MVPISYLSVSDVDRIVIIVWGKCRHHVGGVIRTLVDVVISDRANVRNRNCESKSKLLSDRMLYFCGFQCCEGDLVRPAICNGRTRTHHASESSRISFHYQLMLPECRLRKARARA